jgi:hypothetical protein
LETAIRREAAMLWHHGQPLRLLAQRWIATFRPDGRGHIDQLDRNTPQHLPQRGDGKEK